MACLLGLVWWKGSVHYTLVYGIHHLGSFSRKNRIHMHPYQNCFLLNVFPSWFREGDSPIHRLKKSWKSLLLHHDEWEKNVGLEGFATRKTWTKSQKRFFASIGSIVVLTWRYSFRLLVLQVPEFGASSGGTTATTTTGKNCLLWLDLPIALPRDGRDWWVVNFKAMCFWRSAVFLKVRKFRKSVRWIPSLVYCLVVSYADPFRPPQRFN